jgi:hypothetical protein
VLTTFIWVLGKFSSEAKMQWRRLDKNDQTWISTSLTDSLSRRAQANQNNVRASQRCARTRTALRWVMIALRWNAIVSCPRIGLSGLWLPRVNHVVTASDGSWLPRAGRDCLGRVVSSGKLWPRAHCGLGRVMASDESWPMCHVTEGSQQSTRQMKEIDRWLFQSGASR